MNECKKERCKKIIKYIKDNPYIWAFVGVIVLLVIPFLIWLFYYLGRKGTVFIDTSLSEDGAFSFYGSLLAFLGTIALGCLALWQNQKISSDAKARELRENAMENYVLFDFSNLTCCFYSGNEVEQAKSAKIIGTGFNGKKATWKYNFINEEKMKITLNIKNIGNYPAINIMVLDDSNNKAEDSNILHSTSDVNDKEYILKDDSGIMIINVNLSELSEKHKLTYKLSFQNPFGIHYTQNVIVENTLEVNIIQVDAQGKLEWRHD